LSTLVTKMFNRQAAGGDLDAGSAFDAKSEGPESATLYSSSAEVADDMPVNSRDLIAAAQALLGLDPVDLEDGFDEAAFQDRMRQQAAVAGDDAALAGKIAGGMAAGTVAREDSQQEKEKKSKSEFEMMLIRIEQMERQLNERIAFMEELARELEAQAAQDFEESAEAFAIGERGQDCISKMREEFVSTGDISERSRKEGMRVVQDVCRVKSRALPENLEHADARDYIDIVGEHVEEIVEHAEQKHDDGNEKLESSEKIREIQQKIEDVQERTKGMSPEDAYEEYKKVFESEQDGGAIRKALELIEDKEVVTQMLDKYNLNIVGIKSVEPSATVDVAALKPPTNDGMW